MKYLPKDDKSCLVFTASSVLRWGCGKVIRVKEFCHHQRINPLADILFNRLSGSGERKELIGRSTLTGKVLS